jgi:hypothetical protein
MAGRRLSRKLVLPAKERHVMKNVQSRGSAAARGKLVAVCSLPLLGVAGVAAAFLVTAGPAAGDVCQAVEYPVKAVGGTTGMACQQDGTQPSVGYVSYPRGEAPRYVGDRWDNFWSGVVVNGRGQIVDGHGHLVSRTGPVVIRSGLVVQGQGAS